MSLQTDIHRYLFAPAKENNCISNKTLVLHVYCKRECLRALSMVN